MAHDAKIYPTHIELDGEKIPAFYAKCDTCSWEDMGINKAALERSVSAHRTKTHKSETPWHKR